MNIGNILGGISEMTHVHYDGKETVKKTRCENPTDTFDPGTKLVFA